MTRITRLSRSAPTHDGAYARRLECMIWLFHGVLSLAETQVWVMVSRESSAIAVFLLTLSATAESRWGPRWRQALKTAARWRAHIRKLIDTGQLLRSPTGRPSRPGHETALMRKRRVAVWARNAPAPEPSPLQREQVSPEAAARAHDRHAYKLPTNTQGNSNRLVVIARGGQPGRRSRSITSGR
jgi:hypothetical protein